MDVIRQPIHLLTSESKREFCADLSESWAADGSRDSAEIGRICQIIVQIGEIYTVEDIKYVQSEINADPLVDTRSFYDTEIESLLVGAAKCVTPEIADSALR